MKIVVIEDHTLVREMLVLVCQQTLADAEIADAQNGRGGLELCRQLQPDLVILDVVLPDIDGLNLLDELLAAAPKAKVIALSSHADEFTLHRAQRSQVHGFVDKNHQPLNVLREAIEKVMAGQRYFSSTVQRTRAAQRKDPAAFDKVLSDWEQALLGYFGQGLTNAEIAERVGLSAITVKNHRCRIMTKIGVHSAAQLVRYAIEKGFARAERGDGAQPEMRR